MYLLLLDLVSIKMSTTGFLPSDHRKFYCPFPVASLAIFVKSIIMMGQKLPYCNEFHKMKATKLEPRNQMERPPSFWLNPDFRFLFFRRKIWRIWYELIVAILKLIFFMWVSIWIL